MESSEKIKIQIHPRAFAAFGEELVTSDSVAVLELVKNAYDAYALQTVDKTLLVSTPEAFFLFWVQKVCT